jgi:hypothetical protein
MSTQKRTNLIAGLLLILLGLALLAAQFLPDVNLWIPFWGWPMYVMAAGGVLLLMGLLFGEPDMAVPACIVTGIGGILAWQNTTDNWTSWSYVWALVPGFAGLGVFISGLFKKGENARESLSEGLEMMLVSGVLFVIFSSVFGKSVLGPYWPVLLIALGVWSLGRAFFRRSE